MSNRVASLASAYARSGTPIPLSAATKPTHPGGSSLLVKVPLQLVPSLSTPLPRHFPLPPSSSRMIARTASDPTPHSHRLRAAFSAQNTTLLQDRMATMASIRKMHMAATLNAKTPTGKENMRPQRILGADSSATALHPSPNSNARALPKRERHLQLFKTHSNRNPTSHLHGNSIPSNSPDLDVVAALEILGRDRPKPQQVPIRSVFPFSRHPHLSDPKAQKKPFSGKDENSDDTHKVCQIFLFLLLSPFVFYVTHHA